MNFKHLKLTAVLLAVGTMGLASCGGSDDSGNGGSPAPVVDPTSTYAKIDVPEGIIPQVNFWYTYGDKIETEVLDQYAAFKSLVAQKEGVTLGGEFYHYGNYNDTISIVGSNIATGTGPTMAIAYPDSVAALMKQYPGTVINMQEYMDHEVYGLGTDGYLGDTVANESDFIKSYLEEGRSFAAKGTYVLPHMKSSEILLYNLTALKTIFKSYKPEVKEGQIEDYLKDMTFDEMMNIAEYAYTNRLTLGLTNLDYPVFYDSDSNMIISQLEQKGLKFATRSATDTPILNLDINTDYENTQEAFNLINQYRVWHNKHLLTTKGAENTYASDSFKNVKTIFSIGSSGGAGYSFPEAGSFEYGVCKVPYAGDEEDARYISQGPSIAFFYNKSRSAEENKYDLIYSWKFYKYLTNTTNNVIICCNHSEGYVPVKKSCYRTGDWQEFLVDEDNMYARTATVLRQDIGDNFITSLVFNGSAKYREEAGAVVANALLKPDADIYELLATCVQNTLIAMGN